MRLVGRDLPQLPTRHAEGHQSSIHRRGAEALSRGCHTIITGDYCDVPFRYLAGGAKRIPLIAREKVRYRGEPVAAVAAVDDAAAEAGSCALDPHGSQRTARSTDTVGQSRANPMRCYCTTISPTISNVRMSTMNSAMSRQGIRGRRSWCGKKSYDCAEVTHMHMDPHAGISPNTMPNATGMTLQTVDASSLLRPS